MEVNNSDFAGLCVLLAVSIGFNIFFSFRPSFEHFFGGDNNSGGRKKKLFPRNDSP